MFSSSSSFPNFMCSFKPNNNNNNNNKHKIQQPHFHTFNNLNPTPATDRVIYFGKYKGKMLGSLSSTYLKWVSKNLRAGDFEDWAKLADQVLLDPVYKDRLEWEFANTILNGNNNNNNSMSSSLSGNDSAVSKLLEISERFGWDNEDKVGWRRINFELLGTSKGGRIPRLRDRKFVEEEKEERKGGLVEGLSESGEDRRRKERRERRRVREDKLGFLKMDRGSFGNWERETKDDGGDRTVEINKSFPGREGLLRKVLNRRRSF